MKKERLTVTKQLCEHVQILLKGGATAKQAAQITGASPATISRIRQAEYDVMKYNQNNDRRRIEEKDRKADGKIAEALDQLQGQMKMELVYDPAVAEEYKKEQEQKQEENRMMRFQAGQVSLLLSKLDRLNDTMSMILRAVRRE